MPGSFVGTVVIWSFVYLRALAEMEAAGILRQRNIGRQRYRVFEASDVIDLFTGLERALASPTRNTAWRR